MLTGLRGADPYPVQVLREIAFDSYQRLKPRVAGDPPVRVVDVDEASLAQLGQWPWPRSMLAEMTDRLTELGAAAIGFDMLFPEADRMSPSRIAETLPGIDVSALPDNDALFASALARGPSVLGFSRSPQGPPMTGRPKSVPAVSGLDPRANIPLLQGVAAPLPALRDAAPGLAAVSLNTRASISAVRQLPMLWTDGEQIYPTLSVETLRIALGLGTMVVLGDTEQAGYVDGLRLGPFTIPTTSDGGLWLYYSEPQPQLVISAADLMGDDYLQLADKVAGRIILIGTSASGLLDLHNTTLGDNVAGVTVHAQAIDQIVSNTYLTRPDWVRGLELVSFFALGLLLVAIVLYFGPTVGLIGGTLALGAAIGFSWWMFSTRGIMLDPSWPLVGAVLTYTAMVFLRFATTDAAKRQIRKAFGYYVSPALLSEIEKSGSDLKLGGDTRRITVLFSDMRGFTALSEKLDPPRILRILNTLFGALGNEIVGKFGTIDKFIGDAIMAFWNAPVDVPDQEARAMEAALGMRERLAALNAEDAFRLKADKAPVEALGIGIGINAGDALVGNMGLDTRFDYSALGDTVNVASRIESATKDVGYDIVVTGAVADAAPEFALLPAGALALKGKAERVTLFVLVGSEALASSAAFSTLRSAHEQLVAGLHAGADVTEQMARCRQLAADVEPGLPRFYDAIAERLADFGPPVDADQSVAAAPAASEVVPAQ
ncbi:CHASE2 domain-containing protein [Devosia sp.]|uniref:CHASE2 domain-containing protein n=1 Tax=Devosia sp. TaxID=1871048 RepID=UPI003A90FD9D